MTERQAADAFVEGALVASIAAAGLTWPVYPDRPGDGVLPPYVVYGGTEGPPLFTNGAILVMDEFTYTVRATAEGNVSSTDAFESAIQDALAGPRTTGNRLGVAVSQNGFRINSKGAGALSSVPTLNGRTYRYAGGRFSVKVRPLP